MGLRVPCGLFGVSGPIVVNTAQRGAHNLRRHDNTPRCTWNASGLPALSANHQFSQPRVSHELSARIRIPSVC